MATEHLTSPNVNINGSQLTELVILEIKKLPDWSLMLVTASWETEKPE